MNKIILALEMDFWRRSARASEEKGLEMKLLEKMDIKIQMSMTWAKQLVWYGHLHRMDEERLPQKSFNWMRTGRSK
jgi:hypothetical protein